MAKSPLTRRQKPFLVHIRSSIYYIALVTGMGLLTDICLYPLYTPAIPFRLEELGYGAISSKTGWLSSAYAAGLIIATFPVTWLGNKYRSKRNVLLAFLMLMAVGVLLFLLVPNYAAMVCARVLQGASGAGIWVLGLALVADNCPHDKVGKIMGLAMVGYSLGASIGQPVGGILYGQLGWKAPSVFALVLIAIDACLRVFVIEKHELPDHLKGHGDIAMGQQQPPSLLEEAGEARIAAAEGDDTKDKSLATEEKRQQEPMPDYDSLQAVGYLMFKMKALTPLLVSFTNGFIVAGLWNTALVLRLNQRYGLDSTKAGLCYFAVAVPAAILSPISGRLTDRFGARPISLICCMLYIPALSLLIIEQLPLAAFIVLLGFSGVCQGLINAPVMVFLALVAKESGGRVGTSHVYGGFNMAFSIAAFVGPIAAGQILEVTGVGSGFKIQVGISAAMALICVPLVWLYMRPDQVESVGDEGGLVTEPIPSG